MGTVLRSLTCHYCGERANTQDHVVPRKILPPMQLLPHWFKDRNIVPACKLCNGAKEWYRSDCNCADCTWCWDVANAMWLRDDDPTRCEPPVVVMETARAALEWKHWKRSLPSNMRVNVPEPRVTKKKRKRRPKQQTVVQWDEGFENSPPPDLPAWML
jgi:hypothetical protein